MADMIELRDWTEYSGWLKDEMKKQGLSSYKLEGRYGIPRGTIQDHTRLHRCPNLDSFLREMSALGKKVLIVDKEDEHDG